MLLGGLDAPTGGQSQRNPQPVLLRLTDNAILPNRFRFSVKECFIVGAGYGDLSSERAYIRTETLSCVTQNGQAIDVPIKGYVAVRTARPACAGGSSASRGSSSLMRSPQVSQRDLTAERQDSLQRIDFSMLPLGDAIKTVRGNGSRVMAVFSDPDCPYCKRLEPELAKVNDVTVYTFLMPLTHDLASIPRTPGPMRR